MKYLLTAPAARELEDAIEYYESERPGLGGEFSREFEEAIHHVLAYPNASPRATLRTRRHRVARFPYQVIFEVRPEVVIVHAVAHLRRRPLYWRGRL